MVASIWTQTLLLRARFTNGWISLKRTTLLVTRYESYAACAVARAPRKISARVQTWARVHIRCTNMPCADARCVCVCVRLLLRKKKYKYLFCFKLFQDHGQTEDTKCTSQYSSNWHGGRKGNTWSATWWKNLKSIMTRECDPGDFVSKVEKVPKEEAGSLKALFML